MSSPHFNHYKQDEGEQTEEDTISLSDFPISSKEEPEKHGQLYRRSSSEPSEFFEFFSSHETQIMSHAEDIILCGKLIPLHDVKQYDDNLSHSMSQFDGFSRVNHYDTFSHRYCEVRSLPDLRNRTHSTRSLDSETVKLRRRGVRVPRKSDHVSDFHQKFGKNRFDVKAAAPAVKPSWYVLVFGQVKFPAEMELRDIKSRQVRRSVSGGGGGGGPARRCGWGQDWLRVLSCKSHSTVAVVPPMSLSGPAS